jgi:hypothetical protein
MTSIAAPHSFASRAFASSALACLVAGALGACSVRTEEHVVSPPPPPVQPTRVYVPAASPHPPPMQPDTVSPSRDEYGFRYDAKGNRIDRHGNIISPHSTTP